MPGLCSHVEADLVHERRKTQGNSRKSKINVPARAPVQLQNDTGNTHIRATRPKVKSVRCTCASFSAAWIREETCHPDSELTLVIGA